MKKAIDLYKQLKKNKKISKDYKHSYAFVGIGNHAIDNLYPVINYLHLPLKYIVTKGDSSKAIVNEKFDGIIGTTDINEMLNDSDVKGVFVCTSSSSHFGIAKKVLEAGKDLFIEKPPCINSSELNELIDLEKSSKGIVLAGVQKRYSPYYKTLKNNIKGAKYYSYKYQTGNYPEGDEILDLFIHPIDVAIYLFGAAKVESVQHISAYTVYDTKYNWSYKIIVEKNNFFF